MPIELVLSFGNIKYKISALSGKKFQHYFYISSNFFSFDNATTKYPQAKYFNDDGDENLW